jgi:hypothetical protein
LIEQIRGTNLEPGAKEKVERLLRTVLTLVELLQRKNTSIIDFLSIQAFGCGWSIHRGGR